jgi:hypothetical protein
VTHNDSGANVGNLTAPVDVDRLKSLLQAAHVSLLGLYVSIYMFVVYVCVCVRVCVYGCLWNQIKHCTYTNMVPCLSI